MINIIMLELSARIKCHFFYDEEIAFLYDEKGFDNALDYGSCLLEVSQILLLEIQQYRWSRDVSLKPLTHLCLGSPNIVEPKLKRVLSLLG